MNPNSGDSQNNSPHKISMDQRKREIRKKLSRPQSATKSTRTRQGITREDILTNIKSRHDLCKYDFLRASWSQRFYEDSPTFNKS